MALRKISSRHFGGIVLLILFVIPAWIMQTVIVGSPSYMMYKARKVAVGNVNRLIVEAEAVLRARAQSSTDEIIFNRNEIELGTVFQKMDTSVLKANVNYPGVV